MQHMAFCPAKQGISQDKKHVFILPEWGILLSLRAEQAAHTHVISTQHPDLMHNTLAHDYCRFFAQNIFIFWKRPFENVLQNQKVSHIRSNKINVSESGNIKTRGHDNRKQKDGRKHQILVVLKHIRYSNDMGQTLSHIFCLHIAAISVGKQHWHIRTATKTQRQHTKNAQRSTTPYAAIAQKLYLLLTSNIFPQTV